jgi:hypothetical protein
MELGQLRRPIQTKTKLIYNRTNVVRRIIYNNKRDTTENIRIIRTSINTEMNSTRYKDTSLA